MLQTIEDKGPELDASDLIERVIRNLQEWQGISSTRSETDFDSASLKIEVTSDFKKRTSIMTFEICIHFVM
jgi:hypothetical protein